MLVQEFLLYDQIHEARHDQILKILAGVAAHAPQRILERHIFFKPLQEPEEPGSQLKRGGNQTVNQKQVKQTGTRDLYFTSLIQSLKESDFLSESAEPVKAGQVGQWSSRWQDVPIPGDHELLIRQAFTNDLKAGDYVDCELESGKRFVSEMYVEGHRYIHNNIIIQVYRHRRAPNADTMTAPSEFLPKFDSLNLCDPSGAYIVEVKIRVQDFKEPATLASGTKEMLDFKNFMKGCLAISKPDRLDLDPRVKWQPKTTTIHKATSVAQPGH